MAGPYYSDHFTATVSGTSVDDPRFKVASGVKHATVRYSRASATAPASITTGEIMHMMKLKTGDRLHSLYISTPSFTGTGQPANIGLYQGDGTVIDADILADEATAPMDDLSVAINRVQVFANAGAAIEGEDAGKALWQLADEGAGTYTEDPLEEWFISITMGTESSISAGAEIVLEAFYTSDGN